MITSLKDLSIIDFVTNSEGNTYQIIYCRLNNVLVYSVKDWDLKGYALTGLIGKAKLQQVICDGEIVYFEIKSGKEYYLFAK